MHYVSINKNHLWVFIQLSNLSMVFPWFSNMLGCHEEMVETSLKLVPVPVSMAQVFTIAEPRRIQVWGWFLLSIFQDGAWSRAEHIID